METVALSLAVDEVDEVVARFVADWHARYKVACPVSAICFNLDLRPSEVSATLDRLQAAERIRREQDGLGARDVVPVT
jgi:DNA-binding MarR family transcriptional regulator